MKNTNKKLIANSREKIDILLSFGASEELDTSLDKYRLKLKDGLIVELTERIIEERGTFNTTKYRFHWQNKSGELIKRWDNAPHHPEINSFPDHLHDGAVDNVKSFRKCSVLDILTGIISGRNRLVPCM